MRAFLEPALALQKMAVLTLSFSTLELRRLLCALVRFLVSSKIDTNKSSERKERRNIWRKTIEFPFKIFYLLIMTIYAETVDNRVIFTGIESFVIWIFFFHFFWLLKKLNPNKQNIEQRQSSHNFEKNSPTDFVSAAGLTSFFLSDSLIFVSTESS